MIAKFWSETGITMSTIGLRAEAEGMHPVDKR
jgi:hypothetical protein